MSSAELEALQNLYPFNQLTTNGLQTLSEGVKDYLIPAREEILHFHNKPDEIFYLLDGAISFIYPDCTLSELSTRFVKILPIADMVAGSYAAVATTDIHLISVNFSLLNKVLAEDQPHNPQVTEYLYTKQIQTPDWKDAFTMASGFKCISSEILDQAFLRMESVHVKKGETIIKQGDEADYFYVIAQGRCEVLRESSHTHKTVKLTEYGPGACLGEDALVSGLPRNASVRMLTNGKLMRLDSEDFRFYFNFPLTRPVKYAEAEDMVSNGARWLDVRMPQDISKTTRIPGSICIPHSTFRSRLFSANPDDQYVVVCNSGNYSASIAFVMRKYGYDAFYLEGGLNSIPEKKLL